jgi:hypothetical protein
LRHRAGLTSWLQRTPSSLWLGVPCFHSRCFAFLGDHPRTGTTSKLARWTPLLDPQRARYRFYSPECGDLFAGIQESVYIRMICRSPPQSFEAGIDLVDSVGVVNGAIGADDDPGGNFCSGRLVAGNRASCPCLTCTTMKEDHSATAQRLLAGSPRLLGLAALCQPA